MPRPKRRAAATAPEMAETTVTKRQKTTRSKQAPEEPKFSAQKLHTWFKRYTTDDPNILGPDGMERFCQDIKLEPEDIAMLCIAYKMNAKNMGYFSQQEWTKGLADPEVMVDTPEKLQNKLYYFYNLMNDPQTFKFIFRYAYDFARVRLKILSNMSILMSRFNYASVVG